jgi:hypothetical protein
MDYTINIAKDGHHYFATTKRSLRTLDKAIALFKVLQEKFPESEGYTHSLSKVMNTTQSINVPRN